MKMNTRKHSAFIVAVIVASIWITQPFARASIIIDTVTLESDWAFGGDGLLSTSTQGSAGAFLSLLLDVSFVLSPNAWSLGIAHAWYEAPFQAAFDPAWAAGHAVFASNLGGFGGAIDTAIANPFYLAFWLDANENLTPDTGDEFGWALIERSGSSLQLIGSATETTGAGIYVGTLDVVPEPASVVLLGLGLLFVRRFQSLEKPT